MSRFGSARRAGARIPALMLALLLAAAAGCGTYGPPVRATRAPSGAAAPASGIGGETRAPAPETRETTAPAASDESEWDEGEGPVEAAPADGTTDPATTSDPADPEDEDPAP